MLQSTTQDRHYGKLLRNKAMVLPMELLCLSEHPRLRDVQAGRVGHVQIGLLDAYCKKTVCKSGVS